MSGVAFGSEPFDLASLCGKRLLGVPECGYRVVLPALGVCGGALGARPRCRRSRKLVGLIGLPTQEVVADPLEADSEGLLGRGPGQDLLGTLRQRQRTRRPVHIGRRGEAVKTLLCGLDRVLTVGKGLVAGNNVASGLREGVASGRDFDQGTVDALLLDLNVATDVGHPLVRFGDRRNQ